MSRPRPDGPPPDSQRTILGAIQHQILTATSPKHDTDFDASGAIAGDTSLTFHGCSGDARQVEVLRDAILTLLRDNPDLTEADITVMCPRLSRFAPLIQAIWGPSAQHSTVNGNAINRSTATSSATGHNTTSGDTPASSQASGLPALRYDINSSTLRTAAPVLDGLARLLTLLTGRITHSQLRTFLTLDPVQLRFGLEDQFDLGTATGWLESTAMRWGLDPDQRAQHSDLPTDYRAHTLDLTAEAVIGSLALPATELIPDGPATVRVDLSSYGLAGHLAEFTNALTDAHHTLVDHPPGPMSQWSSALFTIAERFLAVPHADVWQWERLREVFDELTDAATEAPLTIHDVGALFNDAITTRPGRRIFGTGSIIIDAPKALRTIPHRVICLLGFDDDAVPKTHTTNDDLIAANPQPEDLIPAEDAKQQLLDALLAAQDHLVVTFSDHDVHTNAQVQPSTALQELLDVVTTTTGAAVEELIRQETRYAFSELNFIEPARSFDGRACEASLARRERPAGVTLSIPSPLDIDNAGSHPPLSPWDLVRAAVRPTDILVGDTLGVRFPWGQEQPADLLPVELNSLETWSLGDDLLTHMIRKGGHLAEADIAKWLKDKGAAGLLPPGVLAERAAQAVIEKVAKIVDAVETQVGLSGPDLVAALTPATVGIDLETEAESATGSGFATQSILGAVQCRNGAPSRVFYSRRKRKDEIRLWVETLLLAARGGGAESWLIGGDALVFRCHVEADAETIDDAIRYLANLHQRARTEVVPLFPELSNELVREHPRQSKLDDAWFNPNGGFDSGDRTENSVALFFDNWTLEQIQSSEHGVVATAQELYGHIAATTSVWEAS